MNPYVPITQIHSGLQVAIPTPSSMGLFSHKSQTCFIYKYFNMDLLKIRALKNHKHDTSFIPEKLNGNYLISSNIQRVFNVSPAVFKIIFPPPLVCLNQDPNRIDKSLKSLPLPLQPGMEPGPLAVKARNPNHWTAREFLLKSLLTNMFSFLFLSLTIHC